MPLSGGELVTETLDYDGGRKVTVYLPSEPPEAVVFSGDGQLISPWGEFIGDAGAPPTMIVGVHRLADETLRLHEYSPSLDPERFAAHERFFVVDVRHWLRARFGVERAKERTAVFGVSAGGELALAIGLRHPDVYGAVFCASPGGDFDLQTQCLADYPGRILSQESQNLSFATMRHGGQMHCGMQEPTSL